MCIRDSQKAGYYVPAYLKQHGYRIIPVNPNLSEGLGEPAYAALADVPEPIDLVLLFQMCIRDSLEDVQRQRHPRKEHRVQWEER